MSSNSESNGNPNQSDAVVADFETNEDQAYRGPIVDLVRNGNGQGNGKPNGSPEINVIGSDGDGTLEFVEGEFIYTPAPDFNGTETFSFTVGDSDKVRTVTFSVIPVNDDPIANDDEAVAAPGENLAIDVLANDSDDYGVDPAGLSVVEGEDATTLNARIEDGQLVVDVPETAVNGDQYTVTYQLLDDEDSSITVTAEVVITVEGDPVQSVDGSGQDGYIAGATVWADNDGDGTLDWTDTNANGSYDLGEGEPWAVTDAVGDFALQGDLSGTLVLQGGTDIATGLAFNGTLRAPAGSSVVTPVTTLVVAVMETALADAIVSGEYPEGVTSTYSPGDGLTALSADDYAVFQSAAENTVKTTLGIDETVDISNFDPIATLSDPDATPEELAQATDVFATGSQILNTITITASAVSGSSTTVDGEDAESAGYEALAQLLSDAEANATPEAPAEVSLADTDTVTAVVEGTAAATDTVLDEATTTSLVEVVEASNTKVEETVQQSDGDGLTVLTEVTATSQVAQGETAEAVSDGEITPEETATYTEDLDTQVDEATVGDVTGEQSNPDATGITFIGTGGDDVIDETTLAPTSLAGDDTLAGRGGNDTIDAGAGDDIVTGGEGIDVVLGGAGNNDYNGGAGFDILDYSNDAVTGPLVFDIANGTVTNNSDVTDTISNFEKYQGGSDNDTFMGADGADIERFVGGPGDDVIDGGGGANDGIDHRSSDTGSGIVANLATGIVLDEYGNTDTVSNIERVYGTRYDDQITGDAGDNFFIGAEGSDAIDGGEGTDLWATNGGSVENGGESQGVDINLGTGDVFNDGYGNAETVTNIENVYGSLNNDSIVGDAGANLLFGGAGDDFLSGAEGDDVVLGSLGNDTLVDGAGSDYLEGGAGADTFVIEGGGNDSIGDFESGVDSVDLTTQSGGSVTAEYLQAQLDANAAGDAANGFDGGSFFQFTDGSTLWISHDDAAGQLTLSDFVANPTDPGQTVDGAVDSPDALLEGGTGDDVLNGQGTGGTGSVLFEPFFGSGDAGYDFYRPGFGNDTVNGGAGSDWVYAGPGNNTYNLGDGFDYVDYSEAVTGISVDLESGTISNNGFYGTDTVSSVEKIIGSPFDDFIVGSENPDVAERFVGGDGADFIDGGGGDRDAVDYRGANTGNGIVADLSQGTVVDEYGNTDSVNNIEQVFGTSSDDTITGDANDNRLLGGDGVDVLDGGEGFSDVWLTNYEETQGVVINLQTGVVDNDGFGNAETISGFEWVFGSLLDDQITGDDGDNYLFGDAGNDVIAGGAGFDSLEGSAGGDTFAFDFGNGSDTVLDYNQGEGDQLQLLNGLTILSVTLEDADGDGVADDTVIVFDDGTGNNGGSVTLIDAGLSAEEELNII